MRMIGLAAMLMLAGVAPTRADPPSVKCLIPAKVWNGAVPLAAAATTPPKLTARLTIGEPAFVKLGDVKLVRFPAALGKPAAAGDKGGLLVLGITTAGTYRIAIQHKAWIDVVQGAKSLASAAHAHGGACSGIAKTVDFALTPGDYTVQLSDTAEDSIGVLVTKQP